MNTVYIKPVVITYLVCSLSCLGDYAVKSSGMYYVGSASGLVFLKRYSAADNVGILFVHKADDNELEVVSVLNAEGIGVMPLPERHQALIIDHKVVHMVTWVDRLEVQAVEIEYPVVIHDRFNPIVEMPSYGKRQIEVLKYEYEGTRVVVEYQYLFRQGDWISRGRRYQVTLDLGEGRVEGVDLLPYSDAVLTE